MNKKIVVGILAHVDAGKTTLSEAMLYTSGSIRKIGRVDKKNAFLDTYELERERGITIFSKQAEMNYRDFEFTLLDTPGHVDFSTEMERTLQVLDYAILVISGADGCQGHTQTLWKLLQRYQVPVFLFINKMDQPGTNRRDLMLQIRQKLSDGCVDFSSDDMDVFYDHLAMTSEEMMEAYLEEGEIAEKAIKEAIKARTVFPCYFGSALKLEGVDAFLEGMRRYALVPTYGKEFGARVFKISRDAQGKRLTHLKVTGGSLKTREMLKTDEWEEKVNEIRMYSGTKYESIKEAQAGMICAVTGLTNSQIGEGFGIEKGEILPMLEPVLNYQVKLEEGVDPATVLPKLKQLEEEDPQLHISWKEELKEIQVQLMGDVQIEILQNMMLERFGIAVTFDEGNIVYKESILDTVEGVGHYEPLRHYAEVHVILEPGERGSGVTIEANCSEDELDKNWQRLILTHLYEREHRGTLIGAPITDLKITLVAGRAHKKHTEGGDFRQATYRAVRQGLRQARGILLEPVYEFRMELPDAEVGRAMMDVDKMHGTCKISYDEQMEEGMTLLVGNAPVACMRGYQREFASYTKGFGKIFYSLKGYERCHNEDEVVQAFGYDPEADLANPTGSIFCSHGAGVYVDWDQVKDYMHLDFVLNPTKPKEEKIYAVKSSYEEEAFIGDDEVEQILSQTFFANRTDSSKERRRYQKKRPDGKVDSSYKPAKTTSAKKKESYLLIDGYNIIFAWDELKELAKHNLDSARDRLLDILADYHGTKKGELIVVFDAYRVEGHKEEIFDYQNIHVVFTKEAETADAYIEKFTHQHKKDYDITVATSDHMEQVIIRGAGSYLLSAREFEKLVKETKKQIRERLEEQAVKRFTIKEIVENAMK